MFLKAGKKCLIAVLIFLLSFGLYYYSAARTNSGYGDSDEILTTSYLLGSAHPPGYPLQIILTKLFTSLPWGGSYAFRANLFAGFLHSLTLACLFLLCLAGLEFWEKDEDKNGKKIKILGIVFGVFILGLSALFWLYASVLEVFSLNNFLTIVTAWSGLAWYKSFIYNFENENKKKGKENFYFFLSCSLLGIGLSHVQTFILMFPGFLGLFIFSLVYYKKWKEKNWQILIGALITVIFFVLINLSLFWLNSRQANVSWWFEQSWSGWLFQVRRGAYARKFVIGSEEMTSQNFWKAYWGGFDLVKYIDTIPKYFSYVADHFNWIGLLLGFLGMAYLFSKNKVLAGYFLLLYLFSGLFLAMLMGVPDCDQNNHQGCRLEIGVSHRQYLQGEVLWAIFICFGAVYLFEIIYRKMKKEINVWFVISIIISLGWGIGLISHWNMGVNRNNSFANDFAKAVLKDLPQGAVLIASGDLPSMAIFYVQEVEGFRQDVKFFTRNRMIKKYFMLANQDYYGYFFDNATEHMVDLIGFNVNMGRDVFLVDFSTEDAVFLGLGEGTYFTIPYNYSFKIVDEIPDQIPIINHDLSRKLLESKINNKNYIKSVFIEYAIFAHINNAKLYSSMGRYDEAVEQAKLALAFRDSQIARQVILNPEVFRNERYNVGGKVFEASYYLEKVKQDLQKGNNRDAYVNMYLGLMLDPVNEELRKLLANFYVQIGNPERAETHYNYLKINQDRLRKEVRKDGEIN